MEELSQREAKDVPKCVEKMLDCNPSPGSCIHSADLEPVILPALLHEEQEQEQKYKFMRRKPDCTDHHHQAQGTCHMFGCKSCVQVHNDDMIFIGAYNQVPAESPTDPGWLVALNPESYLNNDEELTRGLMWCRDPACGVTKRGRALYKVSI